MQIHMQLAHHPKNVPKSRPSRGINRHQKIAALDGKLSAKIQKFPEAYRERRIESRRQQKRREEEYLNANPLRKFRQSRRASMQVNIFGRTPPVQRSTSRFEATMLILYELWREKFSPISPNQSCSATTTRRPLR